MGKGFQSDLFVVTVNGSALCACQIHGGEAVDAIGNAAPMAAVRALYHEIRRYDAALPGGRHRACHLIPARAIGARDAAGVHAVQAGNLDVFVLDRLFDIGKRRVHVIRGIEADVGYQRRLGRNDVGGRRALHLSEGDRGAHERIELAAALFADQIQHPTEAPEI